MQTQKIRKSVNQAKSTSCTKEKIICAQQLSLELLAALFNNEIIALRITDFCQTEICENLSNWFMQHQSISNYNHEEHDKEKTIYQYYGVQRVGIPYNVTYQDADKKAQYYEQALPAIRQVRHSCQPYLSPMDHLRLELDEIWQHGANIAVFENKKMFVGIGRIMQEHTSYLSEMTPHIDMLPENFACVDGQFAANIYLSIPEQGGELEIWDMPPASKTNDINITSTWRDEYPTSVLIKPESGELILMNTRRPHAIRSFKGKTRISIQCFLAYNKQQALQLWN